jgi:predicted transcriptional regulator
MSSATFTVRVDAAVKKRLEKLAKSTGRRAMASMDRGEGIPHQQVKQWVRSWGSGRERPMPKPRKT